MNAPIEGVAETFDFNDAFKRLSGHGPFPWQRRLFHLLCNGCVPPAVDIPTGLGKTAVMACWLLARANGAPLPRRLVYVVDRRVVVDQATEFAKDLRDRLDDFPELREKLSLGGRSLPISTLRGQHLDNKEWLEDPVATSIVVGTVDMIGSRLLFSGYGVSRKMRPNAAGLLGCDSLVVLDEAHLSRPFEHLLSAIERQRCVSDNRQTESSATERDEAVAGLGLPPPFRLLPLSATLGSVKDASPPFQLSDEDKLDSTVNRRLNAPKALRVTNLVEGTNLDDALADAAWDLYLEESATHKVPVSLVVYCNSREIAEKVTNKLKAKLKDDAPDAKTILFTGGRRVRERQRAADELQECGLVSSSTTAPQNSVFLVATSAGEVGVDLDADHMVCDLVPWERMVQRLGRVNRRGTRAARVHVIDVGKHSDEAASARLRSVRQLLSMLPRVNGDGHQAGPGALRDLGRHPDQDGLLENASTPEPLYPALTGELVDAWSLTSLTEHTGRPEVGPWIRGWTDDEPHTSVAWRRFLPLRFQSGVAEGNVREGETFFEAAPLQAAELLETETSRVAGWLKKRVRNVFRSFAKKPPSAEPKDSTGESESDAPKDSVDLRPLAESSIVALLLDNAGKLEKSFSLKDLSEIREKELHRPLAGHRLVVDARLGGLQDDGLLDAVCDTPATTAEGSEDDTAAEGWGVQTVRVRLVRDESRGNESVQEETWLEVLALPYEISAEGDERIWLVVEKQPVGATGEDSRAVSSTYQGLAEHQRMVVAEVARIANGLNLNDADRAMLVAAAEFHDAGKGAQRWQRAFNARREGRPFAKTPGPLNLSILSGYRHEFQSVLDAAQDGLNGIDRSSQRYDLALHLIAAHHGNARPVIGIEGCDTLPPTVAGRRAREIASRFVRLQNDLGHWELAWWESLLRAADRRASKQHADDDRVTTGEDKQEIK